MEKPLRSPLRYIGGKGPLAAKLNRFLAFHDVYVEVFGGGASLLFYKKPSPIEVYNDINPYVVNFFRVLKEPELFKRLQFYLSLTLYSRREFYNARDSYKNEKDPVLQAFYYLLSMRFSFGAAGQGWSYSVATIRRSLALPVSSFFSLGEVLSECSKRFSRVIIESRDFRELFPLYDSPTTLFYCDPPYIHSTRMTEDFYDEFEMTDDDHKSMVELFLKTRGMVLLSGYEHEIYEPLERAGWLKIKIPTSCHIATNKSWRFECVWLNPLLAKRLVSSKSLPLRRFKGEKSQR